MKNSPLRSSVASALVWLTMSCGGGGADCPLCTDVVLLVVTTTSLPDGAINVDYGTVRLTATGGGGSYVWALASGSLATGLSLAANGDITGTPRVDGTSNFTVEVTSVGQTAQQALSIFVVPGRVLQPSELCSDNLFSDIATFEDANLEAAVRSALGVGVQADLTCGLVSGLTDLNGPALGIESLVGIQNLTSLTTLGLSANSITDISALSGLTGLTILSLRSNTITDISPLSALTSLRFILDLSSNSITDISTLSGLTSLRWLDLHSNSITDLSPLSGLTSLTNLELHSNSITDLSPLSGLTSLDLLGLSANSITDISMLSGLTSLMFLSLSSNSITDLSPLSGLTSLVFLKLSGNPNLTNIQPLLDNTGLGTEDTVWLQGTNVSCADVAALQAKGVTVTSDCP